MYRNFIYLYHSYNLNMSNLQSLPPEIFFEILQYVRNMDIYHTICCCENLHYIFNLKRFWTVPPLCCAAKEGHTSVARKLIDEHGSIHWEDRDNESALFLAAAEGHEAVVRLLLKRGADPRISLVKRLFSGQREQATWL